MAAEATKNASLLTAATTKRIASLLHEVSSSPSCWKNDWRSHSETLSSRSRFASRLKLLQDDLTSSIFRWGSVANHDDGASLNDDVIRISQALDELEREIHWCGEPRMSQGDVGAEKRVESLSQSTQEEDDICGTATPQLECQNNHMLVALGQPKTTIADSSNHDVSKRHIKRAQSMANVKALREKLQQSVRSLDSLFFVIKDDPALHQEVVQLRHETSQQRDTLTELTIRNHELERRVETLLYERKQCLLLKRVLQGERSSEASSCESFEDICIQPVDMRCCSENPSFSSLVPREPIAVLLRHHDEITNQSNANLVTTHYSPSAWVVKKNGSSSATQRTLPQEVQKKVQDRCDKHETSCLINALSFSN